MSLQERTIAILDHPTTQNVLLGVIVFNAIILGLETSPMITAFAGPTIEVLDTICLAIFVIEIIAKISARHFAFFKNGWNVFDILIVGGSLIPGNNGLAALRALRIIRVMRVISVIPTLRRVVEGFISALPGMGSVFLLMGLVFYIGAVMTTKLFGEAFPEWFGSLSYSAYTLFQIMTLESWSMGIVRPVMEVYPYAWLFFVSFIMITSFAVVNLLVGLIVNSMQVAYSEEEDAMRDAFREDVRKELDAISKQLEALTKR